ncbi:MAG: DUF177 domain-containing protein [Nitrospirae bacterium]|nr:DUF177 domain-containing protein [Nitrospirota bacterium]
MRITVSSVPETGLEQEIKIASPSVDIIKGEVQVFLRILKAGGRVLVNGRADTTASMSCSRCLEGVSYPLDIKFNVEYLPLKEVIEVGGHELTEEELDVSFYENDQIDVEELVREQILLAVPMKPLCRTDCRGICPKCGRNLNEGACSCIVDEIDPRLAKLREFQSRRSGIEK